MFVQWYNPTREVSGHVFVCRWYRLCLFLRFFIGFENCSDSVVFLYVFSYHHLRYKLSATDNTFLPSGMLLLLLVVCGIDVVTATVLLFCWHTTVYSSSQGINCQFPVEFIAMQESSVNTSVSGIVYLRFIY